MRTTLRVSRPRTTQRPTAPTVLFARAELRASEKVIAEAGQDNPPITTATARSLLSLIYSAEVTLGCIPSSSQLPAAEQGVTTLIDTIDANASNAVLQSSLRLLATTAGEQAALRDHTSCTTLATLVTTTQAQSGKKLTAARANAIVAATKPVQTKLSC